MLPADGEDGDYVYIQDAREALAAIREALVALVER